MTIQIVDDLKFVKAVQKNYVDSQYSIYLNHVLNDILSGRTCYLSGGAVRDSIVAVLYGDDLPTKDFDILVDDSRENIDLHKLFSGISNVHPNAHGSVKWRPEGNLEIDVTTFSNANPLADEIRREPSLEYWLTHCDLTTGSIAYGIADQQIYDYVAIEGINKREVEVLRDDIPSHRIMARLILHSDKMDFIIGVRGLNFIRQHYSPDIDGRILKHLDYHNISDKFDRVKTRLTEIAQSQ